MIAVAGAIKKMEHFIFMTKTPVANVGN